MLATDAFLQAGGSGASTAQLAIAVGVIAAAFLFLAVATWRSQYVGLSSEQAAHKSALKSAFEAQQATSLAIPTDADFRSYRGRIRSLWSNDPEIDDHTTIREAMAAVHRSLLDSWTSLSGRVPKLAIWLVEEGIAILVLGALAVVSIEQWESLFSAETGRPDGTTVIDTVVSVTTQTLATGQTLFGMFPYGEVVWALGLGYGLLAYELLYVHWYVIGLVLILGGVSLALLDYATPSVDATPHLTDRGLGYLFVQAVVAVWAAGVIPTMIGQATGDPTAETVFATIGFLAAFVTALAMVGFGLWAAFNHLRFRALNAATERDLESWLLVAYLAACRIYATIAAIAATLIPVYLGVVLLNGRLIEVWAAFWAGSTDIQIVAGLLFIGVVAVLAWEIQDVWPDLRASIGHTLSSRSVRLALFGRAMPFGVIFFAYLMAIAFELSVLVAAIVALLSGVAARLGYLLLMRARYRLQLFEPPEQTPNRILIEAYTIEDADGTERYIATVNRERIARDDIDSLVDEVLEHAESLADDGQYATTLGQHYATNLFEYGIVGEETSRKKLRERVRKHVYTPLKQNNARIEESDIEDNLEEYPDSIVEERLQKFRTYGTRDGKVFRRDGYFVLER
ncbi:hypothetical protein [Natronorubrum daqingense]|uniref:Uncharacterized protein n=1 Tax=Natronorubrum daqingense TaxID=588898 RepID=A0A1N7G5U7_9EURY|nr:hypothetical protein [Natronorubrum daqingense]APX98703.1 hypothetical protein BB347_18525 [Natronorubrum daqingense]SIS07987.1 hypothetical protein SAMN05421809_3756 [Natronorubrum daqingense]